MKETMLHRRRCNECGETFLAPSFIVSDDDRTIAELVRQYAKCPTCGGQSEQITSPKL